jgi:hypothetical protein
MERYYLCVILLVNAVLAIWFALFTQHAMEHPLHGQGSGGNNGWRLGDDVRAFTASLEYAGNR